MPRARLPLTVRLAAAAAVAVGAPAAVVLVAACGPGTPPPGEDGGACPMPTATACPSTNPPSYSKDVVPIFDAYCGGCHYDGGIGTVQADFTTYKSGLPKYPSIPGQLLACRMPPADAGVTLPLADEQTLLQWVQCAWPNN